MKTQYDTPYVHFQLLDGILIATIKKGLKIDLPIAKQVISSRLAFTGDRKLPVLIQSEGHLIMDKEARDFMASPAGTAGLTAAAMLPRSTFEWGLGIFYLRSRRPSIPSRIFTHYESAIKWLKNFVF